MADGAFDRFFDAAAHIEISTAQCKANGAGAARFSAGFLSLGVEIKRSLGALHLAQGSIAVQVEALGQRLGQAVVRHALNGGVASEQVGFGFAQSRQQRQDALPMFQGTVELGQRRCRQR